MILWCPSNEATTVSIVWISLTAPSGHFKNFLPAFNGRADYTQLIKRFRESPEAERRYSPPQVVGIDKVWRQGSPRTHLISTGYVERQNLTMRMQIRMLTRLTNAHRKCVRRLWAAVSLHFTW